MEATTPASATSSTITKAIHLIARAPPRHDAIAKTADAELRQQPLNGHLRPAVRALAEVMLTNAFRARQRSRGPCSRTEVSSTLRGRFDAGWCAHVSAVSD